MHESVDVLIMFGLLLAGLGLSTAILQAACALYNKFAAVSLGSRSRQMGHAGAVEVADMKRCSSTPGGTDNPGAEYAGRAGGVLKLDPPQAFGIVFATTMVTALLGFLISKVLRSVGVRAGGGPLSILPVAHLITLPVGLLVMGAMLPASFGRGLLVALLYLLIWLALASIILTVFFGVALASAGLSG